MMEPRTVPLDDTKDKSKSPPPRRTRTSAAKDKVRSGITDMYNMLGMGALAFDPVYGQFVMDQSESMADAWMDVAESNPKVMQALVRFTEGAGVGSLIMAHVMLAAPILARRGIVPAPIGIGALVQSQWVQDNGGAELAMAYIVGATHADTNGNGGSGS